MSGGLHYVAAIEAVVLELNAMIATAFKSLIESKHLYQSVKVDFGGAVEKVKPRIMKDHLPAFANSINQGHASGKMIIAGRQLFAQERGGNTTPVLQIIVSNCRLFCPICKGVEPFTPLWYHDATNELAKAKQHDSSDPPLKLDPTIQLFVILFRCQGCLEQITTFLVRREGWKFSVHGRSPIEEVTVPSFIPKLESHWLKEAAIARNASKTLAAILYLRTFIEQFARRVTQMTGRFSGDEIFAKYNSTLPDPPRSSMPSLKEMYDNLSEAIHDAREDEPLLESSLADVDRHFDFRRLHKIPETLMKRKNNNREARRGGDTESNQEPTRNSKNTTAKLGNP